MQKPHKLSILATLAVALMLSLGVVPQSSLQAQETDPNSITTLLEQLDSPTFLDRETATEKLVELGPKILQPTATYFFDASSEAGWRIRHILEGIGKNGDEKDFLKSIAIIQILYGDQDSNAPQRLAKLQYQWKETRRAEATKQLEKLGFKFEANQNRYGGRDAALQIAFNDMPGLGLRQIDQAGKRVPNAGLSNNDSAKIKWQNPRVDQQATMDTISQIINGNADKTRNLAEQLLPISQSINLPQGTLEIPADWKSDERTLKLVSNLGSLSSLKLRNQSIDSNLQKFIASQTGLKNLQLIDCKFDEHQKDLVLPASIYQYEFEGTLPPPEALKSLGAISTLILRRTSLPQEAATVLSQGEIKIIELEDVEFDRQSIQQLLNIRGLLRVRVSLCDFKLAWLEESRRKNPNLVSAVPKAFLGVQGGLDDPIAFRGAQISQVVAGTAAAEAGMESLDEVIEANGEKIARFEDLRLLICQKRPGETLAVKVNRGGKELDLNIKLGSMDNANP